MRELAFTAWSVAKEIDVNALARRCGLDRRYAWEEPVELDTALLRRPFGLSCGDDARALVYAFGSIVTVNGAPGWVPPMLELLAQEGLCAPLQGWRDYTDDFLLRENGDAPVEYDDDSASFPAIERFQIELTGLVLAKTVALDRIEAQLGRILETAEGVIDRLESGRIRMGERKLAALTSRTLRHEYDSISYIQILDKPDITWSNAEAWEYYENLSEVFELSGRYQTIRQKTETLRHILEGFTAINHTVRGLFVEWVIVLLIVLEIVLMVLEYLK